MRLRNGAVRRAVARDPDAVGLQQQLLTAVDRMQEACAEARQRVRSGGWLILMTTIEAADELTRTLGDLRWSTPIPVRGSARGIIARGQVPD